MIFKLHLNNFRGFQNICFEFSRLNILLGENSAGKSSILKFFLALKQSLDSPSNRISNFAFLGKETNMGNYYEAIFDHKTDNNLFFKFEFFDSYQKFFANIYKKDNYSSITTPTILSYELSKDLKNHTSIISEFSNSSLGSVRIIFEKDEHNKANQNIYPIGTYPKCILKFSSNELGEFEIKNIDYEKEAFMSIIMWGSLQEELKKMTDNNKQKIEKILYDIVFLLSTQKYLQTILSRTNYINPILAKVPSRIYANTDVRDIKEIKSLEDFIEFWTNNATPEFKEKFENILRDFGIADCLNIKEDNFSKELRIIINEIDSNIMDVGYGVSLQLPIIAQALLAEISSIPGEEDLQVSKGQLLFIEQPEVHLHPKLHAEFIAALVDVGKNNVYFIETHSEHIIRKLQLLVKNKKIDSSEISINYLSKKDKSTVCSLHRIENETGYLNPLVPEEFFDVSYNLASELIK